MKWLADDDPVKIEAFSRMPLIEYWAILDDKIEQIKKQEKEWQQRRKM